MKPILKISMINISLILLFISLSSVTSADVIVTGNNTTSQIQSIITDSNNDIVLEGEFKNLSTLNITRNIKISGKNAIITRNASTTASLTLFNISSVNVIIENLIIKGYNTAIVSNSTNLILRNNQITSVNTAINITTNGNLNNVEIKNNVISTNKTNAYGIYLSSNSGNNYNNIISANKITTAVGNSVGIYLNSNNGSLSDNIISQNNISTFTTGSAAHGIYLRVNTGNLNNNNISRNNITTRSSHGIYILLSTGELANNSITFNNIKVTVATQTNSSCIFLNSQPGTMSKNVISNNNIEGIVTHNNGSARGIDLNDNSGSHIMKDNIISNNNISIDSNHDSCYGIFIYSWSGSVNNTSIYGNNIFVKSTAIRVGASSGTINHLNISYNRILTNGIFIILEKTGSGSIGINNTASANWFGNNTPDMSRFKNIDVLSYYVVTVSIIKNSGLVGENWIIKYGFYLNNTNETGEYNKLPFFLSGLFNITGNQIDERIAYDTGMWTLAIEHPKIDDFTIVLDNEIIHLNEFISQKDKTNLTGNLDGKLVINNTVTIISVLKNSHGKVLANKIVYLIFNGNIIGYQYTDSDGRVSFIVTFNKSGFHVFYLVFEGDEDYEEFNLLKIVKVSENPKPDTNEDTSDEDTIDIEDNNSESKVKNYTRPLNKTDDKSNNIKDSTNINKNSSAAMKNTGNPLVLLVFSLLLLVVPSLITRKINNF